jgi:hypothetical protein
LPSSEATAASLVGLLLERRQTNLASYPPSLQRITNIVNDILNIVVCVINDSLNVLAGYRGLEELMIG